MPDQARARTWAKRFAISIAIILLFSSLYGCGARIVHAQTPTALPPQIKTRYFDSKGKPLAGGQLFTYSAGTTSPLATFTDATGTTQNTDPVILDSTGAASVWLGQNLAYKFVLEDVNGVIQWTVDNVTVSNSTGQSTIFTGGTILNATVFQNGLSDTGGAVNFSAGPTHTLPIKVGTVAGLPATCTVGEEYFATDAIAGENVYLCSATNTWTQQGFGLPFNFIAAGTNLNHLTMGNGSTFDTTGTSVINFGTASATTPAAVGAALPATCSVGQIFFNTSVTAGSNVYLCTSTNTWTQVSGSGSSTPSWASVLGSATNTGTGFILAPTAIGTIPWTINCPSGLTVDCFLVQKNGVNQFEVQQNSLVVVDVPLTLNGNLQATAGYALTGGGSITGSVALGTTTLQGNLFSSASTTVDFHNAAHTLAFVSGTTASKPAACTQGEEYFATDATAGVNLFFCTSTNTWTQMTGGGSNPIWSTVQGGSTNTNTGFVLAPTATGTTPWTVNCPSGITVDCVAYQINGVNQFEVTPTFLSLDVATHILGNIQAQNGLAINGGSLSVQGASTFISSATFNQNIFVGNSSTVDFHNAAHTISTVSGLTASKPATCTAGELYFATDATAGQNLFECATTNTWTQQLNSGGGGGNVSTSGSPLNHQYAIFSPDSTHITGVTPSTAGLPLVSNGTSADPSAQALPVASLVAPSAAGDTICGDSTPAWSECVPGIAGRTVTITTDTIGAGDRLNSVLYNSASAVAVTLTSAASLGNNFAFKACNENTGTVTLTPGAGQINGSGSLALAEGQCISVNSPDNVNYIASISNGAISTDTSLSITRSPFGVQLGLSATSFPFSGGPAGTGFQDVVETAAPANPAAGNCRLYVDSTSGFLAGLNSTGASCVSSGGSTAWSALGNPSGTLSLTMNANVSSFLYNATTGAGVNMWTETDTANNTGTGFLHRIGTAAGSAASALSLFATGSVTNTFGNPFAEVISNPTAATSSQAQSSPKWEICGRTWSGGTPADTPECFSWQVVPGSNSSNPTTSLNLAHESGTTNVQSLNLPLSNFTLQVGSLAVGNSIVNTTNNGVTTIQGGKDNNGASANLVARGGAVSGGSSAVAAGGGLFEGGNDASTSATSSAGGAELLAGAATGATQGLQGLVATVPVYIKGATVTQWNLETESAQMTVADAGASPGYWLCIAEVVGTNTVQCINDGETAVNASAAVTLGHTVCATTTAGKVTDSGGTAACTLGTGVGVVMATSGTWKFPDGTSVTASTTLPIIQIVRD